MERDLSWGLTIKLSLTTGSLFAGLLIIGNILFSPPELGYVSCGRPGDTFLTFVCFAGNGPLYLKGYLLLNLAETVSDAP